jgi:hypothetical protein
LLRSLNTAARVQIVFGDDGEKFGDWPETFETVYTNGWLDRFFSAVEAEPETFAVRPLREGVDAGKSLGLVYLPPASYQEMMVWAQNPADIPRFRSVRQLLWDAGRGDDAERFSAYDFRTVARALGYLHETEKLWQDPRGKMCVRGSKFAAVLPVKK